MGVIRRLQDKRIQCNLSLFFSSCFRDFLHWWGLVAGLVLVTNLLAWVSTGAILCVDWLSKWWVMGLGLIVVLSLSVKIWQLIEEEIVVEKMFIEMDRRIVFYSGMFLVVAWMVIPVWVSFLVILFVTLIYVFLRFELYNEHLKSNSDMEIGDDVSLKEWKEVEDIRGNQKELFKELESSYTQLSGLIIDYSTGTKEITFQQKSSVTICIDAAWGAGKTSLINMVENRLKEEYVDVIWMHFEPWHFGNPTELLRDYFQTLNDTVYQEYGYSLSGDIREYVRMITPVVEKSVGYDLTKWFTEDMSLNRHKEQIRKRIKHVLDKPIVVVIDDIDRMEPDEVLAVIKLVKLVGDFNGFIYVLPFDYERVSEVIVKKFETSMYRTYLRKIVNRRLNLPLCTYEELEAIFTSKVLTIYPKTKEKVLKIFDRWVLAVNATRMRDVWRRQQTKPDKLDDPHFDARFEDFQRLFNEVFPAGDLYDAWRTTKNRDTEERVYRGLIVDTLQSIFRGNFSDVESLVDTVYKDLIKRYADYDIAKLLNGFYHELEITLRPLNNEGLHERINVDIAVGKIAKLFKKERFNSFLDGGYVKVVDRYIEELEKVRDCDGDIVRQGGDGVELKFDLEKINEILSRMKPAWKEYKKRFHGADMDETIRESIENWLVKDVVTPRDAVQLAERVLSVRNWSQGENWRKAVVVQT